VPIRFSSRSSPSLLLDAAAQIVKLEEDLRVGSGGGRFSVSWTLRGRLRIVAHSILGSPSGRGRFTLSTIAGSTPPAPRRGGGDEIEEPTRQAVPDLGRFTLTGAPLSM